MWPRTCSKIIHTIFSNKTQKAQITILYSDVDNTGKPSQLQARLVFPLVLGNSRAKLISSRTDARQKGEGSWNPLRRCYINFHEHRIYRYLEQKSLIKFPHSGSLRWAVSKTLSVCDALCKASSHLQLCSHIIACSKWWWGLIDFILFLCYFISGILMLWISPEKVNQFVNGNMLGQQSETEGVELQLSRWDWR